MQEELWFDKYAPKTIDEMVLNADTKDFLNDMIQKQSFQPLLLWGSPGSGKTTIAEIITKTVKCRTKFVACGEERGIADMLGHIKQYVMSASSVPKFVILDEFGSSEGAKGGMSKEAMEAAKGVFDLAAKTRNTFFIITSNSIDCIPDAILSRCQVFQFHTLPKRQALNFSGEILDAEGVAYEREDLLRLIDACYPDMRGLIGALQRSSVKGKLKITDVETFALDKNLLKEHIYKGQIKEIYKLMMQKLKFDDVYLWLASDFAWEQDEKFHTELGICIADWAHKDRKCVDVRINAFGCLCEITQILKGE